MLSFTIQLSNKKSREKLETDCYVTSRKWEEEVKEKGEKKIGSRRFVASVKRLWNQFLDK